jgi:polysaccharide pyruvyl transferase WcaK-like protein
MKLKTLRRKTTHPAALLCAQVESYVNWHAQSQVVAESYRAWKRAGAKERRIAFARYVAALDREEVAARDYRRTLEPVG